MRGAYFNRTPQLSQHCKTPFAIENRRNASISEPSSVEVNDARAKEKQGAVRNLQGGFSERMVFL